MLERATLPSPTRNTTNDVDPFPPPLELDELELEELDELELDTFDELELEDELGPEPEDELELLEFPPPPIPLLEDELLEEVPPHWPASPPSPPSPIPGRVVPVAQATMTNGVSASPEKASLVRDDERLKSTTRPF